MPINSKRIAKNTVFLYIRLVFVMGVTLYMSRVVLDKLGASDYGLYYVVFGVIGMVSFLNTTLSSGTSRFITFALGRGDLKKLSVTFTTTLITHICMALLILIIGETIGLWYATHVMVVAEDRMLAAMWVYQISILSSMISILHVPFYSEIMAHERMNVYAYVGIYEALAKLFVVYLLVNSPFDKLVSFAFLQFLVSFSTFLFYVWYSRKQFEEVSFKMVFEKDIFKSIAKFSGWNVIATLSNTLMSQGVIMLFNLFFLPVVVAAQAIANQISQAILMLVNNVRHAVSPQIIKLYAEKNYKESQRLTFLSAEFIFYLLLLLGVPIIMSMDHILNIWLVEVPEYTSSFARLIVLQAILSNFNAAFYTPMVAANKLSKNSYSAIFLCILQFILLWFLFYCGSSPLWARYLAIISTIIYSFIVKPYILWKDIEYDLKELYYVIWHCTRVIIPIGFVCMLVYFFIPQDTLWKSIVLFIISIIVVAFVSYMNMSNNIKKRVLGFVLRKVKIKQK